MIDLIVILLLVFTVLLFVARFFLTRFVAKANNLDNVFTNKFPSEIFKAKEGPIYFNKVINYIYAGISFGGIFIILPNIKSFGGVEVFSIIVSSVAGLVGLLGIINAEISVFYVKQHILISTIFMAGNFLLSALVGVNSYLYYQMGQTTKASGGSIMSIIFAVLAALVAVTSLIIMFNPKLKDWAKLVRISENDNSFVRPKYFPLAFSEWLFNLIHFLSLLIFILSIMTM